MAAIICEQAGHVLHIQATWTIQLQIAIGSMDTFQKTDTKAFFSGLDVVHLILWTSLHKVKISGWMAYKAFLSHTG